MNTISQQVLPSRRPRNASALVIILILLGLMAALMVSNAVVLRRIKVEIQFLEQKQKQRLQTPAVSPPSPP